jgi:adenylyltransferase/sulfurtransferase
MLPLDESRYDRQERIWWWDQSQLASASVLVVGAGALGNEIVKNLSLVGVGRVDIIDMDRIEPSNLARCALFRESDRGAFKAQALARAAASLNPDVTLEAFVTQVQALGSAWLARYTLVVAGLDNREARLWVNTACRRIGMTWVDGAIEGLQGLARVFTPDGPCYECTLSEADLQAMSYRRSCALLSTEDIMSGKTPTNATTASIVAGVQTQEAIKVLAGRPDLLALGGHVWRMEGETMLTSVISYEEDPDCFAHDAITKQHTSVLTPPSLAGVLTELEISQDAVRALHFMDDVIVIGTCALCGEGDQVVGLRSLVKPGAASCNSCGGERTADSRTMIGTDDPLMELPWSEWLWPRQEFIDIILLEDSLHVALEGVHGH